jgi:hypothetical protein
MRFTPIRVVEPPTMLTISGQHWSFLGERYVGIVT